MSLATGKSKIISPQPEGRKPSALTPWERSQPSLALLACSSKPRALSCQDLSVPSSARTDSPWAAGHHVAPQHPGDSAARAPQSKACWPHAGEHSCALGPAGGRCPCQHPLVPAPQRGRTSEAPLCSPFPTGWLWAPPGQGAGCFHQPPHALWMEPSGELWVWAPTKWALQCCSPPWNGLYKHLCVQRATHAHASVRVCARACTPPDIP